jgi:16S rRNA (adenine1518-N6/adenine1519-N6)-dimethyltransferase
MRFSSRRHRYGQHYLTRSAIAEKIVRLAGVSKNDTVLEIGPGKGILTEALLSAAKRVIAVEGDEQLREPLEERFKNDVGAHGRAPKKRVQQAAPLQLVFEDFLKYDLSTLEPYTPLKVVANLPYSIGTEIIFRLLDKRPLFSDLTVMLQKEVVDRLVASPGGKDYGVLAIMTQLYCENKIVLKVAPGAFNPPPKVQSAIVTMKVSTEPRFDIADTDKFERIIRQAFQQRRKMLKNTLGIDGTILEELGISEKARPEEVSIKEFATLAQRIV